MSNRPKFKARVDARGQGEIEIDGKDISKLVSGFEVHADVSEVTRVDLHLIAPELELDIEGIITRD